MKENGIGITRRKAAAGVAAGLGSLVVARTLRGQQPSMKETPSTGANASRTSLHQEVHLAAAPQRIFDVLLDAKAFAEMTGMAAQIDPKAGGTFTLFSGMIEGRNVELVAGQRVVQAWRPASWDPGIYSIAHFELKASGAGTRLVFDHTGFPEGDFDHLDAGWHGHYWEPLKKYLATQG